MPIVPLTAFLRFNPVSVLVAFVGDAGSANRSRSRLGGETLGRDAYLAVAARLSAVLVLAELVRARPLDEAGGSWRAVSRRNKDDDASGAFDFVSFDTSRDGGGTGFRVGGAARLPPATRFENALFVED